MPSNIICHVCRSSTITHYRQKRRDGVWVVTARCSNGHIPEKGKPFYSLAKFDITTLPTLPGLEDEPIIAKPLPLFDNMPANKQQPTDLIEFVEYKRKQQDKFPPIKRNQ